MVIYERETKKPDKLDNCNRDTDCINIFNPNPLNTLKDYFNECAIDCNSPDEIMMNLEEYKEPIDSERVTMLELIRDTVRFIQDQPTATQEAVTLGVLYALQDPLTLETSTRQRARALGLSSGLISYYKRQFEKTILKI